MKLHLLLLISALGVIGTVNAQKIERTSKKVVKKNKLTSSRSSYNFFLLDKVQEIDTLYTEYENSVQIVWSERLDHNILKKSATPYLEKMDELKAVISHTEPFANGEAYKKAVLNYLDAVRFKIELLEKLGEFGANPKSDMDDYHNANQAFNDATNKATECRNELRRIKYTYETGRVQR